MEQLFAAERFDRVIHLAAQAGVRYSLKNPHPYIDTNVASFMNVLKDRGHTQVHHLVYASSSSVYGDNTELPFSEHDSVDHPVSMYAAYRVLNIGNHDPVPLLDFIACIEEALGRKAQMNLLALQDGDVPATYADVSALSDGTGFTPATDIRTGIGRFVEWYWGYYQS